MKLNFDPSRICFLDFETQSCCELTTVHKYATHPSTRALTCCIKVDGVMHRFGPYLQAEDKAKMAALTEGYTICAHNAPFDAAIWERESLPEREWHDTLPCARAAALPGQLDRLSKALGGRGKDTNGARLIKLLCILKPGQKPPAVGPAHKLLLDYCAQDVEELEWIFSRVAPYGERDVMTVDRIVNDRGIPLDRQLLEAIDMMHRHNSEQNEAAFCEFTGDVNPRSSKQMKEWLIARGYPMDSIGKDAVNKFLANHEEMYIGDDESKEAAAFALVSEAIELRREVAGVGRGKIDAAKSVLDDDDRAREQLVYYGAHTGRWSSRRLQVHNMPSALENVDIRTVEPTLQAVRDLVARASEKSGKRVAVSDVLNLMLRRLVRFKRRAVVADYSAVEARCLAWMAGETRMLARFAAGQSVYEDMAEKIFQRPVRKKADPIEYVLAKSVVLGCGYGMSGSKFAYMMNVRLSRAAIQTLRDAQLDLHAVVRTYRETYPAVPKLWKAAGEAVMQAVQGSPSEAGKCQFYMEKEHLVCELPSGRKLMYRDARVEMVVPAYCAMYNMPLTPVPTVVFASPRGYRGFLYGGRIVENMCQACCRDLLARSLVLAESAGLEPFLHVHDELVCDADDEKLEVLLSIMSTPPDWAKGFPVSVEGYSGAQWTKVTDGYRCADMLNGVKR